MKTLLLVITLVSVSCSVTLDPVTGKPVFAVDPVASQKIIEKGVKIINEK